MQNVCKHYYTEARQGLSTFDKYGVSYFRFPSSDFQVPISEFQLPTSWLLMCQLGLQPHKSEVESRKLG